ncbi:hypothetical protein MUP77_05200 [Candidatus Bathyarchaeota archaeon]|nr:hypothetical protein [Candidatus Bathyarchaeota archaeon]
MRFLSRFVIFSHSYNTSTIVEILNHYSEHDLVIDEVEFPLPKIKVDIELPKKVARALSSHGIEIVGTIVIPEIPIMIAPILVLSALALLLLFAKRRQM